MKLLSAKAPSGERDLKPEKVQSFSKLG